MVGFPRSVQIFLHNSLFIVDCYVLQVSTNITAVARENHYATPYILLCEDLQTFLVVDKMIVCDVLTPRGIPFILKAAYFVFNICYQRGVITYFHLWKLSP